MFNFKYNDDKHFALGLCMIGSFMVGSGITLFLSGIWLKYNTKYVLIKNSDFTKNNDTNSYHDESNKTNSENNENDKE